MLQSWSSSAALLLAAASVSAAQSFAGIPAATQSIEVPPLAGAEAFASSCPPQIPCPTQPPTRTVTTVIQTGDPEIIRVNKTRVVPQEKLVPKTVQVVVAKPIIVAQRGDCWEEVVVEEHVKPEPIFVTDYMTEFEYHYVTSETTTTSYNYYDVTEDIPCTRTVGERRTVTPGYVHAQSTPTASMESRPSGVSEPEAVPHKATEEQYPMTRNLDEEAFEELANMVDALS